MYITNLCTVMNCYAYFLYEDVFIYLNSISINQASYDNSTAHIFVPVD